MDVKQLLVDNLILSDMDGLWCPEVPCGCLRNDIAPCGTEDFSDCHPGKRIDYKADEECGCDRQGTDHWHIADPSYEKPTLPLSTGRSVDK